MLLDFNIYLMTKVKNQSLISFKTHYIYVLNINKNNILNQQIL